MKSLLYLTALLMLLSGNTCLNAQEGFSDKTRALYILDISRYIVFNESFENQESFVIALLDRDDKLYWELEGMSRTRKFVQDKPIEILLYSKIEQLAYSNVVFVNKEDDYNIDRLLEKITGKNTLLISEGYPFRTSMINFLALEGQPRFEANEELMNSEGLYVNELFLAQAVKTREDWEALYEITEGELEVEKSITEQQYILIERQQNEIIEQEALIMENQAKLDSLRENVLEKEEDIRVKSIVLEKQAREIGAQKGIIDRQMQEVQVQGDILSQQEKDINSKEALLAQKEGEIANREEEIRQQDEKIVVQAEAIQKQKIIIWAAAIALLLVFGLVYFIWINYRNKKKSNVLLKAQRDQIAYQKKHITDSIEYAKIIQTAILPSMELFTDKLEHFVLFKPRDIVSGDFYWAEKIGDKYVIIAADCTGHGVPGAFMSMLGVSLLNEIILNKGIIQPNKILDMLRLKIIDVLKQEADSILKDGMDMTVCLLDQNEMTLYFSGANNPLYLIRNGEITQIKGDKMPVAYHEVMDPFAVHKMKLEEGDTFYTFSDGYADQFGGPLQKKFLAKNFRNLLLTLQDFPMIKQAERLDESFEDYRKNIEQVDDVVVIGVRV